MALISEGMIALPARCCAAAWLISENKIVTTSARAGRLPRMFIDPTSLSIRLLNDRANCSFVLNHAEHISDAGELSGVIYIKSKREVPPAASVDVTRQYLRVDVPILKKRSGLGEHLTLRRAADSEFSQRAVN